MIVLSGTQCSSVSKAGAFHLHSFYQCCRCYGLFNSHSFQICSVVPYWYSFIGIGSFIGIRSLVHFHIGIRSLVFVHWFIGIRSLLIGIRSLLIDWYSFSFLHWYWFVHWYLFSPSPWGSQHDKAGCTRVKEKRRLLIAKEKERRRPTWLNRPTWRIAWLIRPA